MKKLTVFLFLLGISTFVFAELKPKDVVGKWKYNVDTGGEQLTGVFNFMEKDGNLAGEVISANGDKIPFTKIEIKNGNELYLELKTDYDLIKITFKVDGKKYSGMASNSEGEAPISGEKVE